MADHHVSRPPHGDEAEIFREFNEKLMALIARAVSTSTRDTVEDACAHAWAQFMRRQPDRDANWRGWLFVTAQREAWALEHDVRRQTPVGGAPELSDLAKVLDAPDLLERLDELCDGLALLGQLPRRLRRVALMRALGLRRADIVEVTGESATRVDKLISNANLLIDETLAEWAHAERPASPRAERLWQIEHEPPDWLIQRIGRPLRPSRRVAGQTEVRRAWRRAALALDDLRTAVGSEAFDEMRPDSLTEPGLRTLHIAAATAVAAYDGVRAPDHGRHCER